MGVDRAWGAEPCCVKLLLAQMTKAVMAIQLYFKNAVAQSLVGCMVAISPPRPFSLRPPLPLGRPHPLLDTSTISPPSLSFTTKIANQSPHCMSCRWGLRDYVTDCNAAAQAAADIAARLAAASDAANAASQRFHPSRCALA